MNEAYSRKLKDPRWRHKRTQVLERDNWCCTICFAKDNLDIDHKFYVANKEPWEYDLSALRTLCRFCHDQETVLRPIKERYLLSTLRRHNLTSHDIATLADSICKIPSGQLAIRVHRKNEQLSLKEIG